MTLMITGLAWLAGLGVGQRLFVPDGILACAVLAGLGALLAPRRSPWRLAALVVMVALLGLSRGHLAVSGNGGPLTSYRGEVVALRGSIADAPRCTGATCQFVMAVDAIWSHDHWQATAARVQVRTGVRQDLTWGRSLWLRGQLRVPRDTPGFTRTELFARRGIHETLEFPLIYLGAPSEPDLRGSLEAVRAGLERRLSEAVPGPSGALAAGLLLGRDVALGEELRTQLRRSGTGHLLAVSGYNVALVGGLVLWMVLLVLPRSAAVLVATVGVAAYTLLVGAPPSAVRAALMFATGSLATLVGRLVDPPTSLVLAAALMAGLEPHLLGDVGFQLSFAATLGLVLLAGRLTPSLRRLPRWFAEAVGVSLAAQLLTLPLVLYHFHSFSLVAPVTNLLITPLVPVTTVGAILTLLTLDLPLLSGVLPPALSALASTMLWIIAWSASLPGAGAGLGALPLWALSLAYAIMLSPFVVRSIGRAMGGTWVASTTRWGQVGAIVSLLVLAMVISIRPVQGHHLSAWFFDSSGDGLSLVTTPGGRRLLAGSASSPLAASAVAERLPFLDRAFDLLVVVRGGERDLAGLFELAHRYPIHLALLPEAGEHLVLAELRRTLEARGTVVLTAQPGMIVGIDEDAWLEVETYDRTGERAVPRLGLRLHYGRLDLRLVGGRTVAETSPDSLTVLRLAPELTANQDLSALLGPDLEQSVVVGGRGTRQAARLAHLQLGGTRVVELHSDGLQARLIAWPCSSEQDRCSWP